MNAIILAAGAGLRLRPHTDDRPKALVEIDGCPIVERQIRHFRERGVDRITIVSGYMAHRFEALAARHPEIEFVLNDTFDAFNNLYSVFLVRDRLAGSYVSEADVFMHANYVDPEPAGPLVFGGYREGFEREWIIRTGAGGRIERIDVQGGAGVIQAGLTYWTPDAAVLLRRRLEDLVGSGGFAALYWDDVFMSLFDRIETRLREIGPEDWTEIDSPSDLELAREREGRRNR